MKISYLIRSFGKTGGSIVLYNFMDNLVKRGYQVNAVTPKGNIAWSEGIWEDILKEDASGNFKGIVKSQIYKSPKTKRLADYYSNYSHIKGIVNNWEESDVSIATFCTTAYSAYYLADRTIPLYHMQHFEELFFHDKFYRLLARNSYKLPLLKMANSIWLQNLIKKNFNEESKLLNPGIDLSIFKHNPLFKEKYKYKKTWKIVSFFDEKREWKGFNDAVQAVKLAREELEGSGISIEWKVYGLNPPLKNYDTDFEFVGKIFNEELAEFYSSADIVLSTSWYESFPLPPIEAMACGSLIISTQYGVEDYLIDNKNGLVTLPRQIEEIAKRIVWAVSNPERVAELVNNGIDVANQYSWDKRTDELETILNQAVSRRSLENHKLFNDLVEGSFDNYMHEEFKIKDN